MAASNSSLNPIFGNNPIPKGINSPSPSSNSSPIDNPNQKSSRTNFFANGEGFITVNHRKKSVRTDSFQNKLNQYQKGTGKSQELPPRVFKKPFPASNGGRFQIKNASDNSQNKEKLERINVPIGKASSTWAKLVKKGGHCTDLDLTYIPPTSTIGEENIVIVNEEISLRTEFKWGFSVVAYIFGKRPPYHHFRAFVARTWNPSGSFEIFTRENGFFSIRFTNIEDCEKLLNGGPYFINGKLIILKKWSKRSVLDRDLLSTLPIWIRLPKLSLRLWDKEAFSAIASVVGVPLKLDEQTAKETHLSYARILVEINADADLPNVATIYMLDGEVISQPITYESIPDRCKFCKCFGHATTDCGNNKDANEKSNENSDDGNKKDGMNEFNLREDVTTNTDPSMANLSGPTGEDNMNIDTSMVSNMSSPNLGFQSEKGHESIKGSKNVQTDIAPNNSMNAINLAHTEMSERNVTNKISDKNSNGEISK